MGNLEMWRKKLHQSFADQTNKPQFQQTVHFFFFFCQEYVLNVIAY